MTTNTPPRSDCFFRRQKPFQSTTRRPDTHEDRGRLRIVTNQDISKLSDDELQAIAGSEGHALSGKARRELRRRHPSDQSVIDRRVRIRFPDLSSPGSFQESEEFESLEAAAEWLYRNWGCTILGQALTVVDAADGKLALDASARTTSEKPFPQEA
jgi:hypothetical protein